MRAESMKVIQYSESSHKLSSSSLVYGE